MIANVTATCTYYSCLYFIIFVTYVNDSLLSYSDFYTNTVMKINSASISEGFKETAIEHNMHKENQKTVFRQLSTIGPNDIKV